MIKETPHWRQPISRVDCFVLAFQKNMINLISCNFLWRSAYISAVKVGRWEVRTGGWDNWTWIERIKYYSTSQSINPPIHFHRSVKKKQLNESKHCILVLSCESSFKRKTKTTTKQYGSMYRVPYCTLELALARPNPGTQIFSFDIGMKFCIETGRVFLWQANTADPRHASTAGWCAVRMRGAPFHVWAWETTLPLRWFWRRTHVKQAILGKFLAGRTARTPPLCGNHLIPLQHVGHLIPAAGLVTVCGTTNERTKRTVIRSYSNMSKPFVKSKFCKPFPKKAPVFSVLLLLLLVLGYSFLLHPPASNPAALPKTVCLSAIFSLHSPDRRTNSNGTRQRGLCLSPGP